MWIKFQKQKILRVRKQKLWINYIWKWSKKNNFLKSIYKMQKMSYKDNMIVP